MAGLTIGELLEEARSHLVRLRPLEAQAAHSEGAVLVDTRSEDQRIKGGTIPESIHIPLSVLEWRVDPASGYQHAAIESFEDLIVLICEEGYSSSLAARRLQQLGFLRATDMVGGFCAWRSAGLPVDELSD
ncbi:MAG: rhodanese-like domain-containing protein [Actinomycetota bacterium]|nr:rhodanese-like domain-containing protein [Actinomycetota bacterium]